MPGCRHRAAPPSEPLIRRIVAAPLALIAVAGLSMVGLAPAEVLAAGTANDDAYGLTAPFVLEDKAFVVAAPGVLGNDTPGPGESLCIVSAPTTSAQGGTVSLAADGSFSYTSPVDYAGADSFTYGVAGVAGGGPCPAVADDTATVNLTVTQVNDAPSIGSVGACAGGVTVSEDAATFDHACVAMDPGPDNEAGQEVTAALVEVDSTFGFSVGPTVSSSGVLQFRALENANGEATVSIRARDNGGTANGGVDTSPTIQVTITVTPVPDAPVATADSFVALKDRTLNIASPGVLANDTDADGDQLTANVVNGPIHGSLTLAANGSFSYTPAAGYVGPDAFSYRASDGSLSSPTRIVSLTVSAVPLPTATPVITEAPPSAAPSPEPTVEVTAEPTEEPSATIEPEASTVGPTPPASPGPSATATPRPTAGSGGPSLPVLLVAVLFVVLLVFAGAYFVPRWVQAQRDG